MPMMIDIPCVMIKEYVEDDCTDDRNDQDSIFLEFGDYSFGSALIEF